MFLLDFIQSSSRITLLSFEILPSGEFLHLLINKLLTSKSIINSMENAKSNVGQVNIKLLSEVRVTLNYIPI